MKKYIFNLILLLTSFSTFCSKKTVSSAISKQIEEARRQRNNYHTISEQTKTNRRELYQRGESLRGIQDKTEEMASHANEFTKACQRLRRQQEEKPVSGFAKIAACLCCTKD